ncbi:MAG: manganese-dependent inorganic pyrophosphatase [Candidatus Moraniibacteriota bacterium]|jgi:manganese-dependent inorganic pyrophosphatase
MKHIIGHKNPDTDTTCSGIAYQNFLAKQGVEAQAFALGKLNKETEFVLEQFGVDAPEQITELPHGTEIILLDHNEEKQSIDNIKDLDIVEIIDHHKVKIETDKPISIFIKPLGSSCSIIAEKYFDTNTELTKSIAGLLLSGIISDTLFFRSPTTTDVDKMLADKLNDIVGIDDLEEFSLKLFNAKSNLGDIEVEELIRLDYKSFTFKDGEYGIGVMETTNVDFGLDRKDEIVAKLKDIKAADKLQGVFFVIVDILDEKSYTLGAGEEEIALFTRLFEAENKDDILFVDKLVSRKKQIIPVFENM